MAFDAALRRQILDRVDTLVRDHVAPRAAEVDAQDEFPWDLWRAAAEAGLFGLGIPEEYGGLGRDLVTPLLISERLARASAAGGPEPGGPARHTFPHCVTDLRGGHHGEAPNKCPRGRRGRAACRSVVYGRAGLRRVVDFPGP